MGIAASVRPSSDAVISVSDPQNIPLGSRNRWSAPSHHAQPAFQWINWVPKWGPRKRWLMWIPFSLEPFPHEAESNIR